MQIVNLNNHAAYEMSRDGNHNKALNMLSVALRQTRCYLRTLKDIQQRQTESSTSEYEKEKDSSSSPPVVSATRRFLSCSFVMEPPSPASLTSSRSPTTDDFETDQCFLYKSPLQIHHLQDRNRENENNPDGDIAHPSVAVPAVKGLADIVPHVIVYNLALCHHLISLKVTTTVSKQAAHAMRAVALYDQAKLFSNEERRIAQLPPIHQVVIFNNLGHAHQILGHVDVAKMYFRQILTVATLSRTMTSTWTSTNDVAAISSTSSSDGETLPSQQELPSMVEFLRNAVHQVSGLHKSNFAAAA